MPYVLDSAGVTVPNWAELQADVLAAYQTEETGFGPGADISADSPFYKIASPLTRQNASAWQGIRDLYAQLSYKTAFGLQLDRLGSLVNLKRRGARRSIIPVRLIGDPGTLIGAGAKLLAPTGSQWQLAAAGTIGAEGTVAGEAFAVDFGPVDAPASDDWTILTGQVAGWTAVESTEAASLGALRETDVEFRKQFDRASRGLATYDAIVRELREPVADGGGGATDVWLYVNNSADYKAELQLGAWEARAVVQGGRKVDIIRALHTSIGAPLKTIGTITGTYDPGNGQILDYAYDRLTRRRCYLRLTITGGNPNVPLPSQLEAEGLIFEAVLAAQQSGSPYKPQPGQPFTPFTFGQAAAAALPTGSVTKLVAEGRLDPGDPWLEDAITLGIAEVADVSVAPTPAELVSDAEGTTPVNINDQFKIKVNGGITQTLIWPHATTEPDEAASLLGDAIDGIDADVVDGRLVLRTVAVGETATLELDGGAATAAFFDNPNQAVSGSDADVTVVLVA